MRKRTFCIDELAFEDQLTESVDYEVHDRSPTSLLITNDNGDRRWYGKGHFSEVTCEDCGG